MYEKLSKKITASLINNGIIKDDEYLVYEYSVEVMISNLFYFMIAVIAAISTNSVKESILFYLGFFTVRKFAGGYHADTYKVCHILFLGNQLVMIMFQYLLHGSSTLYMTIVITIVSIICIFMFAPVESKNRKYSNYEYKKFFFCSRIVSILTAIGISILILANVYEKYVFVYAFGMFSVSLSLMVERIKIKEKGDSR